MTKTVDQAISEIQAEIAKLEAELRTKKETVNTLCGVLQRPPLYAIASEHKPVVHQSVRSDQFFGQPLASAVKAILEMRQAANLGAASINEIYEVLVRGGYLFNTQSEEIAKKSLRNSLVKNTAQFQKLPNGRFGIKSWYPKVRLARSGGPDNEDGGDTADEAVEVDVESTDNQTNDAKEEAQ